MAIASLNSRFEQLTEFEEVFGFLFNSRNLRSLDDDDLRKHYSNFVETFTHGSSSDVELNDFFRAKSHASDLARWFNVST
jgi:hypothetical protein